FKFAGADGGRDTGEAIEAGAKIVEGGVVVVQAIEIDVDQRAGDQAGAFLLDVNDEAAVGWGEIEMGVGRVENGGRVGDGIGGGDLRETLQTLAGGVELIQLENQV